MEGARSSGTGPGPSRTVRLAVAAYRAALGAGLRGLRSYRREAVTDFRRVAEEARALHGRRGVLAVLVRAMADLVVRAPGEWIHERSRGDGAMRAWMRELAVAVRRLVRNPLFSGVASLTLALGIGVTVTIFTVIDAILIRPLPYPDSHRIVTLDHHAPGLDLPELASSAGMGRFYLETAPFLETLALTDGDSRNLTGLDRPERVDVTRVSPSLFDVLGVEPAFGRRFVPEEGQPGGADVALLTHPGWVRLFGADPGIIGETVELDGRAHEIVGVMPEGFHYRGPGTVVFVPYVLEPDAPFGTFGTELVARLGPGWDLDRARREVEALQGRVPEFFESLSPEFLEQAGWSVTVRTLRDRMVGDVQEALWVVLGTVGFVLLIACANVANLFLVRAEVRQREMAVRAALGAGRGRLAMAWLSESLVLGLVAGATALGMAWLGVEALVAFGPAGLPRLHEVDVGGRTLLFTLAVSVVAGLFLGSLPTLRYLGRSFATLLRQGGRTATEGRERHQARNVLVAVQLALALVLLVGSGLMLRSWARMAAVDPGLDPEGVLAVGLSAGSGMERAEAARFYQRLIEETRGLPGVTRVGAINSLPVDISGGHNGGSFSIESRPRAEDALPPVAMNVVVAGDAFQALGIPVLAGRGVRPGDHESGAPTAWVNEAFVRAFLSDTDPLTERVAFAEEGPFMDVVGVVGDTRHFGLDEPVRPIIYMPMAGEGVEDRSQISGMNLVLDTEVADPTSLVPVVREVVARLNGSVPVTRSRTMEQAIAGSMADVSFTMVLLGIAATVALLLGAVGIYGVIAYLVTRRTREIGVRMALGADRRAVERMVVGQGMRVSAAGIVVGLVAALLLTRLMASLLFEVSATDPLTFASVAAGLAAVAALASWLPARRAARIEPVRALASE